MGKLLARCALIFAVVAMIGFMIFVIFDAPEVAIPYLLIVGGIYLVGYGVHYGIPWLLEKSDW